MDITAWSQFDQILLTIAVPIIVAAAVGVAFQGYRLIKSKIPGNVLFQLQLVVKTVADAARQSGLLTQLTASEKIVETTLINDAQAFCTAHHIPIGSIASLVALVKAELLKDIQAGAQTPQRTANKPPSQQPFPQTDAAAAAKGAELLRPPAQQNYAPPPPTVKSVAAPQGDPTQAAPVQLQPETTTPIPGTIAPPGTVG